jgi:hypothetical protein
LATVACVAAVAQGAGMSSEQARSLTADIVLIKFEAGVNSCESLGASNLPALYGAMRGLIALRAQLVPTVSNTLIEEAKISYQRGLAQLPPLEVTEPDQIAVICERTLTKIRGVERESFLRMVDSGAKSYQQLFARAP